MNISLFSLALSREIIDISSCENNFYIVFFSDAIKAGSFKVCIIVTLLRVYICRSKCDDLDFVSRVQAIKNKTDCKFLSTVV